MQYPISLVICSSELAVALYWRMTLLLSRCALSADEAAVKARCLRRIRSSNESR